MNISFTPEAWADYLYWQKYDFHILQRINDLIKDIRHSPFNGIGKPEPLRHQLQGFWSRRINQEHRLVYQIIDSEMIIIAVRFHYSQK